MRIHFLQLACAVLFPVLVAVPLRAQFPRSPVDPELQANGSKLYANDCARCHGDDARGSKDGPDLIRSLAVLHDRRQMLYGKELAPILADGPHHNFKFNEKQLKEISQFLTFSINSTLRSGYNSQPTNLLSGDTEAGKAYFDGAGGCSKCHSVSGDFKDIGKRYTPAVLQQKFLFPNSGVLIRQKTQVTVKLASGKTYTGDLVGIDDFTVTLREKTGAYRSFNRVAGTKVTTVDPFAAHEELLNKYTDTDIHNLTTYLATLK